MHAANLWRKVLGDGPSFAGTGRQWSEWHPDPASSGPAPLPFSAVISEIERAYQTSVEAGRREKKARFEAKVATSLSSGARQTAAEVAGEMRRCGRRADLTSFWTPIPRYSTKGKGRGRSHGASSRCGGRKKDRTFSPNGACTYGFLADTDRD